MIKKNKPAELGFTIVELLVVIVVIGVLAAISLVSYTGISNRTNIVSLQVDLSNVSKQLKIFNIDKGYYPSTISTNCATSPDSSTNKCVKPSANNSISLCNYGGSSQSFTLLGVNGNNVYKVTESSIIVSATAQPSVFSSGGTISNDGCYKAHTFSAPGGPTNMTAVANGTIDVTIIGGGGGGSGSDYDDCGAAPYTGGASGGQSKISIGASNYTANGGGGGYCGAVGGPGAVSFPGGFANTTSNGLAGNFGAGAAWDGDDLSNSGVNGGSGGKITGTISVTSGQTAAVTVGAAGGGGAGHATYSGGSGGTGSVVIKYPLY